MTEKPTIDPQRVLAALAALGWRDDRTDANRPGLLYGMAEAAIAAADAAGCPCLPGAPAHRHGAGGYCTVGQIDRSPVNHEPAWDHEIAFDSNGVWSIGHPLNCPGSALGDCDVVRLAHYAVTASVARPLSGGRYACGVNDLGDRFLLGDRVDVCTCPEVDVSTIAEKPGSSTVKGLDRACPVHGRRNQQTEG